MMTFFRKSSLWYRISLFLLISGGVFFAAVLPSHAEWCISIGGNKRCIANFKFREDAGLVVPHTYQTQNDPGFGNKFWPATPWKYPAFCNNGKCVDKNDIPALEMVDRTDITPPQDKMIAYTLRLYGKTKEYWHTPAVEWKGGAEGELTSLPSDLVGHRCSCDTDPNMPDRACGFDPAGRAIERSSEFDYLPWKFPLIRDGGVLRWERDSDVDANLITFHPKIPDTDAQKRSSAMNDYRTSDAQDCYDESRVVTRTEQISVDLPCVKCHNRWRIFYDFWVNGSNLKGSHDVSSDPTQGYSVPGSGSTYTEIWQCPNDTSEDNVECSETNFGWFPNATVKFDRFRVDGTYTAHPWRGYTAPRYYRVKKVPSFYLQEVTHPDIESKDVEMAARDRASAALAAEITTGIAADIKFQPNTIRINEVWGRTGSYVFGGHETLMCPLQFGNATCGSTVRCPCDRDDKTHDCHNVEHRIPWWNGDCYDIAEQNRGETNDQFVARKSSLDGEHIRAQIELIAALAEVTKWDNPQSSESVRAQQNRQKASCHQGKRGDIGCEGAEYANAPDYYPFAQYTPADQNAGIQRSKNDYILQYVNQNPLPTVDSAREISSNFTTIKNKNDFKHCAINGRIRDIQYGADSRGNYVDYILNGHAEAVNQVDDYQTSLDQRSLQSLASFPPGVERKVIAGSECLVTLESPVLQDAVRYFYSTGEIFMPPVEIRSFSVTTGVKNAESFQCGGGVLDGSEVGSTACKDKTSAQTVIAPLCDVTHIDGCLPKEHITDPTIISTVFPMDDVRKSGGRSPTRQNRSLFATTSLGTQKDYSNRLGFQVPTLSITSALDNVPVTIDWKTAYAASGHNGVNTGVKLWVTTEKNYTPQILDDGKNTARISGESVSVNGSKPFELLNAPTCIKTDSSCPRAVYHAFLTATNDRAIGSDDRKKQQPSTIDYTWSVGQRIDIVLSRGVTRIVPGSLTAQVVPAEKNTARVSWQTEGGGKLVIESDATYRTPPKQEKEASRDAIDAGTLKFDTINPKAPGTGFRAKLYARQSDRTPLDEAEVRVGLPHRVNVIETLVDGWELGQRFGQASIPGMIGEMLVPGFEKTCKGISLCQMVTIDNIWGGLKGVLSPILGGLATAVAGPFGTIFGSAVSNMAMDLLRMVMLGAGGIVWNLIDNFVLQGNTPELAFTPELLINIVRSALTNIVTQTIGSFIHGLIGCLDIHIPFTNMNVRFAPGSPIPQILHTLCGGSCDPSVGFSLSNLISASINGVVYEGLNGKPGETGGGLFGVVGSMLKTIGGPFKDYVDPVISPVCGVVNTLSPVKDTCPPGAFVSHVGDIMGTNQCEDTPLGVGCGLGSDIANIVGFTSGKVLVEGFKGALNHIPGASQALGAVGQMKDTIAGFVGGIGLGGILPNLNDPSLCSQEPTIPNSEQTVPDPKPSCDEKTYDPALCCDDHFIKVACCSDSTKSWYVDKCGPDTLGPDEDPRERLPIGEGADCKGQGEEGEYTVENHIRCASNLIQRLCVDFGKPKISNDRAQEIALRLRGGPRKAGGPNAAAYQCIYKAQNLWGNDTGMITHESENWKLDGDWGGRECDWSIVSSALDSQCNP